MLEDPHTNSYKLFFYAVLPTVFVPLVLGDEMDWEVNKFRVRVGDPLPLVGHEDRFELS